MNPLPPLNALRAFEATARLGSMTAAAQELSVTHGAVSRQVGILESHLNVKLFHREGRTLHLSPVGEKLFPAVRGAFEMLVSGCRQARAEAQPLPLQVASPGTYMLRWLIPRLHHWQEREPDIEVRLSTRGGAMDLRREGVDLLIDVGTPPWPGEWRVTELFRERFGPVASPALLAGRTPRQPADLLALPRLHTASRPGAWEEWAQAVGATDLRLAEGQRFAQLYYMLEAALAGIGVAMAPAVLVQEDLAAGRLVAPLGFVDSGGVYFVATADPDQDRRISAFRDWLVDQARDSD